MFDVTFIPDDLVFELVQKGKEGNILFNDALK